MYYHYDDDEEEDCRRNRIRRHRVEGNKIGIREGENKNGLLAIVKLMKERQTERKRKRQKAGSLSVKKRQ